MNTTTGLDTVTFADSQLQYQFDVRLPYREPSALHDGAVEAVWDARVWHHTVTGSVATRDYNYRTASTPMDATVSVRNEAATAGEHYRYLAPYRDAGDDTTSEPETESGAFYARIRHEHALNHATRLHLFSNASHLTPGMVLETGDSGVPELKEGMVITLATFRAARDTRLHVSVWVNRLSKIAADDSLYTHLHISNSTHIKHPVIFKKNHAIAWFLFYSGLTRF